MPDEIIRPPIGATAPGATSNPTDGGTNSNPSADLHDLKDQVSDDISSAVDAVKDGTEIARHKVEETLSEQTTFAAKQVAGIATALQKVGAELQNGDQAPVGRYATQIGESVQSIANNMKGRDLGEIASMAEDFGRRQPLAFLGVAALAGLAASRFLTASAKRSAPTSHTSTTNDLKDASAGGLSRTGGLNNG